MLLRHLHILLPSILLVLAASCADDAPQGDRDLTPGQPGTLTVRLSSALSSRSTDSKNSEEKIDNLLVCLYPTEAGDDAPATAVASFTGRNKQVTDQVTMRLSDDDVAALFGSADADGSCTLMALANIPDGDLERLAADKPSRADLKGLAITSDFKSVKLQSSFVMASTGDDPVYYSAPTGGETKGTATGSALLYRAAAKVNLNVNFPDYIEVRADDGKYTVYDTDGTTVLYRYNKWTPQTGNVRVHISQGVQAAVAAPLPTSTAGDDGTVTTTPWEPGNDAAYYDGDFSEDESVRTLLDKSSSTDTDIQGLGTEKYNFVMDVPFYTYPNAWEESPAETHKTTLTILVPFRYNEEDTYRNYYYQVPVTPGTCIERNKHYIVNLSVGMLGSEAPDDPLTVDECTYKMVDWSQETLEAKLQNYRYLIASPDTITLNNEESVRIPIYSSHKFYVKDITLTFRSFRYFTANDNGTTVDFTFPTAVLNASSFKTDADGTFQTDADGNKIPLDTPLYTEKCTFASASSSTEGSNLYFSHPLERWTSVNSSGDTVELTNSDPEPDAASDKQTKVDNTVKSVVKFVRPDSPEAPYCKYLFTITLAHKDDPSYTETVKIAQYPAMYIENELNEAKASSGNHRSNVYVNGSNTSTGDNWRYVSNSTQNNNNPNMYVISVTQLSSDRYIVGDPRVKLWLNTFSGNAITEPTANGAAANHSTQTSTYCYAANPLYWYKKSYTTTNRQGQTTTQDSTARALKYYYPTLEETITESMIAPKFRIASSYGKSKDIGRQAARQRAATYQEDAYPAGRWRLPTKAEFEFIVTLSQELKIPKLFTVGEYYWTAQGPCRITSAGSFELSTSTTSAYVRSVYDEWYWGNDNVPKSYRKLTPTISGNNITYSYTLGDVPRSVIGN